MIRELLLSAEELSRRCEAFDDSQHPYFYRIARNCQYLYYLGTAHSFDPTHHQFRKLRAHWRAFLRVTKRHECIQLVEGRVPPSCVTAESAIRDAAESGYAAYLAGRAGIPVSSPEPSVEAEIAHLVQQFARDEIAYHYFARMVAQWNRLTEKRDFSEYVNRYLNRVAAAARWSD